MKVEKHPIEKTITKFASSSRRFMFCEPRRAYKFQIYLSVQFTLPGFPYCLNIFHNKKIFFSNRKVKLKPKEVCVFDKNILYEYGVQKKSLSQEHTVDHDSALRPVSFMISYLDRYFMLYLSVGSYLL